MEPLSKREREKIKTEAKILEKAEELFCIKGVENTSMNELAERADYTKRTIYKYFTCKEDLFFAVLLNAYKRFEQGFIENIKEEKTGFEKIKCFYQGLKEISTQDKSILKLMGMIGIAKKKPISEVMPYRELFFAFDQGLFTLLERYFEEGKKDGSIRLDIDTSQLLYSSMFTMTGFFMLLGSTGDSYIDNFHLDKEEFIQGTINLLMDAIKTNK